MLVLTIMIMALVPMMLTLTGKISPGCRAIRCAPGWLNRRGDVRDRPCQMQMNAGLPQGWQQASAAPAGDVAMLVSCSGFLDREDEAWNTEDARISMITITDNSVAIDGTRLAAGVYRSGYGDVTYEQYTVIGCAISDVPNSQGAAMRGEFALSGQRLMLLGLEANGT